VNIVPCGIFDRQAFILRTDANEEGRGHHSRSLVEIACDIKLREVYRLADGDIVEITVYEL
jgi:riboflavin kinase, archaea type